MSHRRPPDPRPRTERLWWAVVAVLGVVGVLLAPVLPRTAALLPGAFAVAVVVFAVSAWWSVEPGGAARPRIGHAASRGLVAGLAGFALATYAHLLGTAAACLLFVAMAAWAPPALRLLERWRARRGPTPVRRVVPRDPAPDDPAAPALAHAPDMIARMSTLQVVTAWRRSLWDLKQATSCRVRAEIVSRRQAYLDELERRDPEALRRWLAAGPRVADNPSKFFRPQDPPSTVVS